MKKRILPLVCSALMMLTGCGADDYQKISQDKAKEMMDTQQVLVLDVREQSEYDSGHIPGAVLLPVGTIDEDTAAAVLVYCRSGSRSKRAAKALAGLGYTGIYEFGGIMSWPYDIVT